MTGTADSYLQIRRSLIARLKNWDDQEIWRRFLNTYGRLIHRVTIQSGLTEQEAQDAVQETVITVAKTMLGFKYDPTVCSFKSWLRHLTRKRIADPASLDLDAVWEAVWKKHIFDLAVARVKTLAGAEQFQSSTSTRCGAGR